MTANTRNGTLPQEVSAAARYYLDRHSCLPVPVPFKTKKVILEGWENLRPTATDLDTLFPAGEPFNIGLLLGEPSKGLVDVDNDCPEAVAAADVLLPQTGWVSGRRGNPRSHYWYRVENPPAKATAKFKDLSGKVIVEFRSTGGQTVVPPSVHESGESVVWHSFTEPAAVDLEELRWAVRGVAAAALIARHWPVKGCRHDLAVAIAGGLLLNRVPDDKARRFLEATCVAARTGSIPTKLKAVKTTRQKIDAGETVTGWPTVVECLGPQGSAVVERARKWLGMTGVAKPAAIPKPAVRAIAPYRPFPVEALPAPIAEYVRQGALALGCDLAYLALPALTVVASVIGNTRTIRLKRGWDEPSVVWSVIVGDSGTLKSPAYTKAVAYLFRQQKRLLQEFREQHAQYERDLEDYQAAKKKGAHPSGPPEKPVYRRVALSDITIEKVAEVLEDNPRGVLVARDELAGWLGSFMRYKGKQGGSDLPHWLEIHRAGTIIVDRKTGPRTHYFVERAAASVTGGIQPGVLARALTTDVLDAGGGARIIMAMPTPIKKRWSEVEIDPEVESAYHATIDKLLAIDFDTENGERVPHVLVLSSDAKALWVRFYNEWAGEQVAAEGELAAAFSKLEGYAACFALIHHVVTHVSLESDDIRAVGVRSMEAGITLARWFAAEARRIYGMLAETADDRRIRRLVEFIRSQGGAVTARRLQRANPAKYRTAADAEAALEELVRVGLADWQDKPTTARGGNPTRVCVLKNDSNPNLTPDTTDRTPGDGEWADGSDLTQPTDTIPRTSENHRENGGSVSCVRRQVDENAPGTFPDERNWFCQVGEVVSGGPGEISETVPERETGASSASYLLVTDPAGLRAVANALEETSRVGLDTETTGLDPRQDRVRLLTLNCDTTDGGRFTYVVDCFRVDPRPLFPILADKTIICHNAAFDLGMLAALGFEPGPVRCTMILSQLLHAGQHLSHKLKDCAERELGRVLNKEEQASDWSSLRLTREQLDYAAVDAEVLLPLYQALDAKIQEAKLETVADIEHRCLPGMVWLARSGVAFDVATWQGLAKNAAEEALRLARELDAAAPRPDQPGMFEGAGWNWDSPAQVKKALEAVGCTVESTDDDALAKLNHPLAELLRMYREAQKRCTTYGKDWLKHVAEDGRVYAGWRQIGAKTGRMSSGSPNLQNVPRGAHRRCFRAPPGRVLVKADYSQIELRIAAKMAGETRMMDAYRQGEDLHTLTARSLTGRQEVSKEERQLAKPVNFGLIYGLGAPSLCAKAKSDYGVQLTLGQARAYQRAFFAAWPGIAAWHGRLKRTRPTETRTLAGRRCLVDADLFYGAKTNYAVQGTGGDGIKLALALLWERRGQCPGACPVLVVHDEIVVECDQEQAEAVTLWLKTAMIDAMRDWLDPVPVEVEVKTARTWGG